MPEHRTASFAPALFLWANNWTCVRTCEDDHISVVHDNLRVLENAELGSQEALDAMNALYDAYWKQRACFPCDFPTLVLRHAVTVKHASVYRRFVTGEFWDTESDIQESEDPERIAAFKACTTFTDTMPNDLTDEQCNAIFFVFAQAEAGRAVTPLQLLLVVNYLLMPMGDDTEHLVHPFEQGQYEPNYTGAFVLTEVCDSAARQLGVQSLPPVPSRTPEDDPERHLAYLRTLAWLLVSQFAQERR